MMLSALLLLSGCATESRLNSLSIGMPKAAAIEIMGNPAQTRAAEGVEYLIYHLPTRGQGMMEYFVRIRDGKVDAYGKPGDFNTPTLRVVNEKP